MSEAKPTPGEWIADIGETAVIRDTMGNQLAMFTHMNTRTGGRRNADEVARNTRLAADAGTVFNTTGLTPSQLVERVKELERALMVAVTQNEHDMLMTGEELRAARAALSKARPNTAEGEVARLLRQILAASQDGDSDTHLSAHFVSRIETITKPGGAA